MSGGQYNYTEEGGIDFAKVHLAHPSTYEPFSWEVFNWRLVLAWVDRNKHYPVVISGIYIALVFGLEAFMRNRKPFGLKRELALWNGALGLFSIMGFVRMFPDFWRIASSEGLHVTLCGKQIASVPVIFWVTVFMWSKVVELGDTIFIVLRKRPIQFLQWYHHAVTLTLTWTTLGYLEPVGKIFILMNYGVHSLMYNYFAAKALDIRVPTIVANTITLLQLVQMVIGFGINAYTSYFYYFGGPCQRHPFSIRLAWLTYGSFLILFGQLFYRLVLKKNRNKAKIE